MPSTMVILCVNLFSLYSFTIRLYYYFPFIENIVIRSFLMIPQSICTIRIETQGDGLFSMMVMVTVSYTGRVRGHRVAGTSECT